MNKEDTLKSNDLIDDIVRLTTTQSSDAVILAQTLDAINDNAFQLKRLIQPDVEYTKNI